MSIKAGPRLVYMYKGKQERKSFIMNRLCVPLENTMYLKHGYIHFFDIALLRKINLATALERLCQ